MSEERRTTEELLFELEQVKRADEDHFQSLLDDMEKIQAERDRLKAENSKLLAHHDGHGAASAPRSRAASPSPSTVRDKASGSTRHDPERAASHKEPLGRLAEAAPAHKDKDSANEKAIAERRLRELAASGFRKRARSPERGQRARDPTPPRKERRRSPRSRSRTRSRDRQRPRSRGREAEPSRDRYRQPRRRSERDSSREHGQRADQGRRRYSRSPHSPRRQSERPSPQPSQSPPRQRGKDVLALPGPAQAQSGSAMAALDPGFAEQLQSMVAPLAALGPALQGIVSMLQAVPAAISSLKVELSERDARNQQELQHVTKQNQELQDELSKVNAKIKTGSEIIDKSSRDMDKLKDRLEAEKAVAAERARKAEASSKALHEQQAQTGKALASVQKQMEDMPSKPAVDPKIEDELTRLRKQVELLEAERQQRLLPAASIAPAASVMPQQDQAGQMSPSADVPASSAGQDQQTGSGHRLPLLGLQGRYRKEHLPPVEPEGLADFAASVWGPGIPNATSTLPPWLQQALQHISCKPATPDANWPSRPAGIMQADVARAVSAALQHVPALPAGSLQLNRQQPGLMQGARPVGMAPGRTAQGSSAPIQPIVLSQASAAQSAKQKLGSSWPPKGPGLKQGAASPALSQGAPPWVQEAQRNSDMLTARLFSDRWQPTQASAAPQSSQSASPAAPSMASLPAPKAAATSLGPSLRPAVPAPQSQSHRSESPSLSRAAPSSSPAPAGSLAKPLHPRTGASTAEPYLPAYSASPGCLPYVPSYTPAYLPMNPARQHPSLPGVSVRPHIPGHTSAYPLGSPARQPPSFQGSPARPARLASAAAGSPSRPAAGVAQPSKPRSDSSQQPSAAAAAAPGKASESGDKGATATAAAHADAQHQRAALQQSPAQSGAPSSQALTAAKQSAAPSMSQAHAKVPNADKPVQQMPASQPNAAILTGSAARQDNLGTGSQGARGSESRRVEPESKNQRKRRQREEARLAAAAAPASRSQQTPEASSKRAKNHHEQSPAQHASAAPKVQAMPPLNPDFICGICERAYSNSAALHLHLIGNEHQVKLGHPKTRQGKPGKEDGSADVKAFRRSFPWRCKLCSRDFHLMRQLADHSSQSDKHSELLQAALRKDKDEAREDGEVAGFAPILSGQALREAWAKQISGAAERSGQGAADSLSLHRWVLEESSLPSASKPTHDDQQEVTGQAAKVDREGGTQEGWQYDSPQHAAHPEGGRHQSREGSVEDGELPRVPVNFSLSASKPVAPQNAQPAAQPSATATQKHSSAPSERAAPAAAATPTPPGPGAQAQQRPAAVEKDSFLPPHLKGLVSPSLKAPMPLQSGPTQSASSAGLAAGKAPEKTMLQPQKQPSHAGHQAKAPAAAPKASGPAKQLPTMPASAAMQQASGHGASGAKSLQAPKLTPAGTTKSSATQPGSSARVGQASTAKQPLGVAVAPAVAHREATEEGHRASAGSAARQKTLSGSIGGKPSAAAAKGSAIAGSTAAAAISAAASKGQPASLAKVPSVSQKPAARPAAASRVFPSGLVQPAISATTKAQRPTASVPVPAEAVAAAASFLNDLGNTSSPPSEALGLAPSGPVKAAAGQLGSKSGPAQQIQPGRSLPKLPPAPPSPEMRLESLMQELSNMAHRLPNAAPAQPQQRPAALTAAASRASGSLQQPGSRSASPANVVPLRVSAPPWQPQQSGSATAVRSAQVKAGRVPSEAEVRAAETLRAKIAELQREIDLKVQKAKKKGQAGKAVPQGQKRPDQAPQAAVGSIPPIAAKAEAEVPKASEQPSQGPSPASSLASKQTPRPSAPVPGRLAAQGEQSAAALGSQAAMNASQPASAGQKLGKQTAQAAAPALSHLAAPHKQSTEPVGNRAAEQTPKPAPSTGEAMIAPAKANAPVAPKQGSSASAGSKLPHEQSLGSSVSQGARVEGTSASNSSRSSALGSVAPSQAAPQSSVPQSQRSQPFAAPDAERPAAKQSAPASEPVRPPQKPSMSASLSQKQTDISGAKGTRAKSPAAHAQEGSLQQPVKEAALPASHHAPAQPTIMPASAGKEAKQLAIHKDQAVAQISASAGAANREAQPVSSDGPPANDKPKEGSARPTAASQSTQPDTHSIVGEAQAGATSAKAAPPTDFQAGRPAAPVAKQREHAPFPMLKGSSGKEAPVWLDPAAAPGLQAREDTPKSAGTERQGSLPATGHVPAVLLPVQALEDSTWASSPSSSATPAYTMLTQTPLGTGSAWPAAAPDKAESQLANKPSQQRETAQLRATPDRLSGPNSAITAPAANNKSVPGPVLAAQRAGAGVQTPQASGPQGRTPPSSGQRAARGRVITTGRRPVQATPQKPSPHSTATGTKSSSSGAAMEQSEAQAGSSARRHSASGLSAGSLEGVGGRAGRVGSDLGASSQSGHDAAGVRGLRGVSNMGSAGLAGVSMKVGRDSTVAGERAPRPLSKGRQGPSAEGPSSGTRQSQDSPAESEDMDVDIMTVFKENSVSQVLQPGMDAAPEKSVKQLQGTVRSAAAGPGSSQPARLSEQTLPVDAMQAAGQAPKHSNGPSARPAPGAAPHQPAPLVGSTAQLAAAVKPSPSAAAQPQKQAPAILQSAGLVTDSRASLKAASASATMSTSAAAKPAALAPQPRNPESRAREAVQPPARAAPLTAQEKASAGAAPQASAAPAKTASASAQQKPPAGIMQSPPKPSAPSLQQKEPGEALPKPSIAAQHMTAEGQGQQRQSVVKALPKPVQAPAKAAAAAPHSSAAPPGHGKEKAPAGISKSALAVKNPALSANLAKGSSSAPSHVPIPAPKQAAPASSAQAAQIPAKYSFLYPQKEDSAAAKPQKPSRSAAANRSVAPASKPAPPAQKVHTSRPGSAGTSAGGAHRPQHAAGQAPVQGQSSKRVVTVSHESHAGNGMTGQNSRSDYEGPEPGEMRMPLQMPPVPMHMHPRAPQPEQFSLLQDPSQGGPFSPERPEVSRYMSRQDSHMEWYHPDSMSMASLPQPWHVHERQMSGHRGHPLELHAQQRFSAHDGRLPPGDEERQQGMHLPPQLPPMPMHIPLGEPLYGSQGQYSQQFLRDEAVGRSERYRMGSGLPPGLAGPDFGGPHSQGYGVYGPPEQLPFPPQ